MLSVVDVRNACCRLCVLQLREEGDGKGLVIGENVVKLNARVKELEAQVGVLLSLTVLSYKGIEGTDTKNVDMDRLDYRSSDCHLFSTCNLILGVV